MPVAEASRSSQGGPGAGRPHHLPPHPTAALLEPALQRHPAHATELFSTFNDLAYSARWTHLEPVQLDSGADDEAGLHAQKQSVSRPALVGWKKDEKKASLVVCLRYNEQITPFLLASIFSALHSLPNPYAFSTPPHGPTLLMPTMTTGSRSAAAAAVEQGQGQGQHQSDKAEQQQTQAFPSVPLDTDAVTVAVLGTDGAVVYYNLAEGIRKPIN
ncbi:hypothetical protein OC845_006437 [Tilletia horrida]|nr:hypothetical protein OC845_006437 [Tilletia horrida]